MVFNRISIIKIIFILFLTILFSALLFTNKNKVETNLAKSILPKNIIENSQIINISEKQSKAIRVVFESDDENQVKELKQKFLEEINKDSFVVTNPDFIKLIDFYAKSPDCFLSDKTRELLLNQDYDKVYRQGLERLYNPTGIPIIEVAKDPFFLLTDFLFSNNIAGKNNYIDGKYYDTEIIKLRPDIENLDKDIAALVKLKNKLSVNGNKIYLGGTPVHTYYTALASNISINIICILITFIIIFLTYRYFRNLKILLPIALSISFGFLAGFAVSKAIYTNFHIITFLFGTTLIGIGIDYSYHYIFAEKFDKNFVKDLTLSLLSTIMGFSLLYLLKIDVLSQIATFTNTGLIAIYLFILILYPCINFPKPVRLFKIKFNKKIKAGILIFILIVIITGFLRIHFDDSLSSLYTPSRELLKAEQLFNKVSNQNAAQTSIIAVKGNSLQNILEEEEKVCSTLGKNNIEYISLSKFIPSIKRQKENAELINILYQKELKNYSEILSKSQINELINTKSQPQELNINEYPFFEDLIIGNTASLIISFSDKLPEINSQNIEITDFQGTVSSYLRLYRIGFLKILPAIYLLLYLILVLSYGFKTSVKMFLPLVISSAFVIAFVSLIGVKLNLFNLLGLLLALGFTIDYSIFGRKNLLKSETAIFLACITTALSFFLLSFTTFKLISTLALTTALGTFFNYILIKVFTDKE